MGLAPFVRAILLDVEGTTTPVSFVYETLFPFAESRLEEACLSSTRDPGVAQALEMLRAEHAVERGEGAPPFGNGADYARYLMRLDRKSTGLKALQGWIWEAGYHSGQLCGEVFDDVPGALLDWRRVGIRLRVFSSGSVLAQRLLFSRTIHGDLTECFEGYHDTTTGPKREAASYVAIAAAFSVPTRNVLFLSDTVEELDAARSAGMLTGLVVRPGNRPAEAHAHPAHPSFLDLLPQAD